MATRNPATFPALDSGAFATTDTAQTLTNKTLTNPVLTTESISLTTNNLPTIRPTLNLDFTNSQSVDPRITFTRASTASRVNSKGLIEIVPSGVPRIDFDPVTLECKGLLIEEERTNLLIYSENFDNAVWTKTRCSITPNVIIAPDGTLTADKLVEDTTASVSHPLQCGVTVAANTSVTLSVFAKAGERGFVILRLSPDGTNLIACGFDLTNGIAGTVVLGGNGTGASATITADENDWYKCSLSGIPSTTVANPIAVFYPSTSASYSGTGFIYTGDGTSGLYIWGAELNAAAFPASYIPSTETHTGRASTATYYNSLGQIAVAASGVARLNYNPANLTVAPKLLLEAASTNLLTYSEQFDNAAWTKTRVTVTANATTAPDGTVTADKIVEDNTAGASHYVAVLGFIFTSGVTYTLSIYAKSAERTKFALRSSGLAFTLINPVFDLSAVSATGGSISSVGSGWYRLSVSFAATSTAADNILIDVYDATGFIHNGDGTSGIYIWGADLKADAYPTSYIPTTSAAVTRAADTSTSAATTRAADVAVMTGANFSSWYRQDEFSASTRFIGNAVGTVVYASWSNATTAEVIKLESIAGALTLTVTTGSVVQAALSLGSVVTGTFYKVAAAWKLNDIAASINGAAVVTDTVAILPAPSQLLLGSNSHVRGYPLRLPNATLVALSTQ